MTPSFPTRCCSDLPRGGGLPGREHLQPPLEVVDRVQMARRRYRAAMRGLDDRAGVDVAKGRALAREDARVVRHFLIGAEGTERAPGDRIEPVDRKYQQIGRAHV